MTVFVMDRRLCLSKFVKLNTTPQGVAGDKPVGLIRIGLYQSAVRSYQRERIL